MDAPVLSQGFSSATVDLERIARQSYETIFETL